MARTRPLGLVGLSEGLRFYCKRACGHTQPGAQHTTAARKIFAESGRAYHKPSSAFGVSGPSYLPWQAPGCREFGPACAFLRQLKQCEIAWNSMDAFWNRASASSRTALSRPLQAGVLGQLLSASSPNPGRMNRKEATVLDSEPELLALPASPPTTHTFSLGVGGCIPLPPDLVYRAHLTMTPLHQPETQERGPGDDRTSASPSLKWTGRAPNPKLPTSAGGLPGAGFPERQALPAPDHGRARYCFDLSLLGATSLMVAKTTARGLLSAISRGLRAVLGPLSACASQKRWPMSSQGSWQKTGGYQAPHRDAGRLEPSLCLMTCLQGFFLRSAPTMPGKGSG